MTSGTSFRRVVGRAARVACAVGLVGSSVGLFAAPARGDGDPVTVERAWRPFAAGAALSTIRLALDAAGRVAYVFSHDLASGTMTVRAWDLDRFTPRSTPLVLPGHPGVGTTTPIAVDERHHVVVVAPRPAASEAPKVEVYALRGGVVVRLGMPAGRFPVGYVILGAAVDVEHGVLLTLAEPSGGGGSQVVGAGIGGVELDQWRLADLANATVTSSLAAPIQVPQLCGQLVTFAFPAAVVASADGRRAYFACMSNRGLVTPLGPNPNDFGGVAELDLGAARANSPTALRFHSVAGNFGTGDTLAVVAQHRLLLNANDGQVTAFKVFDTAHGRYVGNVGLDDIKIRAIAANPVTGRGYYLTQFGFGVYEMSALPVTQGRFYDRLSPVLGLLSRPFEVDPRTSRVLAPTSDLPDGANPYVAVLRDRTPPYVTDTFAPDRGALNAPEREGVTDSTFSADLGAVGAEYRMVGGPKDVFYNTSHFDDRGQAVRPGTRAQQFAVVWGHRLADGESSVQAITDRRDDATSADLTDAGKKDPLICADFGGTPKPATDDNVAVTCDLAKELAFGSATAEPAHVLVATGGKPGTVPAAVQVRSASVSAKSERAPNHGALTSLVTAEADGIDILGVIQIGRVTANLKIVTHGRPGTASVDYQRTISAVSVSGKPVCGDSCSPSQVTDAINQALAGRAVVDFPPGQRMLTSRGALAGLTDDEYRHWERVLFDDIDGDSVVTPAMEITYYGDGATSSRQITSLAEVSGQDLYRIYRVGSVEDPNFPRVPVVTGPGGPTVSGPTLTGTGSTTAGTQPTSLGGTQPVSDGGLLGTLGRNMRVVFRSPRQVASMAMLWMLLALPAYLAARRRLLLSLPYLRRNLEEA